MAINYIQVQGLEELKQLLDRLAVEAKQDKNASSAKFIYFTLGASRMGFKIDLSNHSPYIWYMHSHGHPSLSMPNVRQVISNFLLEHYNIKDLNTCFRDISRELRINENGEFFHNLEARKMDVQSREYGPQEIYEKLESSPRKQPVPLGLFAHQVKEEQPPASAINKITPGKR